MILYIKGRKTDRLREFIQFLIEEQELNLPLTFSLRYMKTILFFPLILCSLIVFPQNSIVDSFQKVLQTQAWPRLEFGQRDWSK